MSKNGSAYHKLLNTSRWRSARASVLGSQPFCADCAKQGYLEPATEVHHIVPVEEGTTPERMTALAYDPGNMVALCHSCHAKRHKEMRSHARGARAEREKKAGRDFWDSLKPPGG